MELLPQLRRPRIGYAPSTAKQQAGIETIQTYTKNVRKDAQEHVRNTQIEAKTFLLHVELDITCQSITASQSQHI